MASRSLNKVTLIGNLTRDPELRYTPSGTAVCTFGLATNRSWVTDGGEKKEEVEFHRLVSWAKLAEICGKFLVKGKKIYIEGRLQTRSWTSQDGQNRQSTEIVIEDMIMLDGGQRRVEDQPPAPAPDAVPTVDVSSPKAEPVSPAPAKKKKKVEEPAVSANPVDEKVAPDDIPF